MPALVAIIGRPNVGKSTLFNQLLGKRIAIESPISGTTRDPVSARYEGEKVDLLFVDTGGLEFGKAPGTIEADMQTQARAAIAEADLILFCIDTRQEITPGEHQVAQLLREKAGKTPVLLVGTKADGKAPVLGENDLYSLGLGDHEPFLVAALQNIGIFELLEACEKILAKKGFKKTPPPDEDMLRLAVVGRPNVGKSSLINALSRSPKLIVSEIAGTTRDAVDIHITKNGREYCFIDTAGIRRESKVEEGIEEFSVLRALRSLQRADIALLLIDPIEGVTHQEKHIVQHILDAKTGLILVVNKSDLLENTEETRRVYLQILRRQLDFLPWAPVLFVSALEKKNLQKIFPLAEEIAAERKKRISTGKLNAFLQEAQHLRPLAGIKNTHPRIKYGTQVGINPPQFLFSGARLNATHFSARRYLENRLRDAFGFTGTPIEMELSTQKNPYHDQRKFRLPAAERKRQKKNRA